jgi:hypothetical protein
LFKILLAKAEEDKFYSGAERSTYLDSAKKSCIARQTAEVEANKDVSIGEIADYCACFADGLSKAFTRAEFRDRIAQKLNDPSVKNRIDRVAEVCALMIVKRRDGR